MWHPQTLGENRRKNKVRTGKSYASSVTVSVSCIVMVDWQLTVTICNPPSRREVRTVPLSADRIAALWIGWASAMGAPPAEMEVALQPYQQFHWGSYIEAADELSLWVHQDGSEASEACRQRSSLLFTLLHRSCLPFGSWRPRQRSSSTKDSLQAPARNRVAFMVQVCDKWGQV